LGFPTSYSYKPSTSFLAPLLGIEEEEEEVPTSTTRQENSMSFLAPLPWRKKTSARGVSHAQSFTLFLFCFILFLLALFYQKYKKISSFIVAFIYLLLVLLE
jgi:hypothetical protein